MTEFENFSVSKPGDYNLPALNTMLDQVVDWSCLLSGPGGAFAQGSITPPRVDAVKRL